MRYAAKGRHILTLYIHWIWLRFHDLPNFNEKVLKWTTNVFNQYMMSQKLPWCDESCKDAKYWHTILVFYSTLIGLMRQCNWRSTLLKLKGPNPLSRSYSQIGQMRLSYGMSASFWWMTFVHICFFPVRERKGYCCQQISAESRLKGRSSVRKPIKEKWLWYPVC